MIRFKSFFTVALTVPILYGCVISDMGGPIIKDSDNTGSSSTQNNSEFKYSLPLKIEVEGECDAGSKTLYTVTEDGTFTYNQNTSLFDGNQENKFVSRKLSDTELKDLSSLIIELNIASLAKEDKKQDPNAPQTEECRAVKHFRLMVNGTEKDYDQNGRLLIHTEAYLNALMKLEAKIESFKNNKASVSEYSYALPLSLKTEQECQGESLLLYQVSEDGTLTYPKDPDKYPAREHSEKKLNASQISELQLLINQLNIAKLAEKDTEVPPDAPQTKECRTIEYFSLKVNSDAKIFDKNGRKLNHSDEYVKALEKLKAKLESFAQNTSSSNGGIMAYTYDLPLKVSLDDECNTGSRTIFEVKNDGTFNYTENDQMSPDPYTAKSYSKKLNDSQLKELKSLMAEINIARLAQKDTESDSPVFTTECRPIENYTMNVTGNPITFDKNQKTKVHSQEYLDALDKLKFKLESFKTDCQENDKYFQSYKTEEVVMKLSREACFGFCPVYDLEIYGNGKVIFKGHKFVKDEETTKTTNISKDKVEELISLFENANYFCLKNTYDNYEISDLPYVHTSIQINGETKSIKNYHGDRSSPEVLKNLEDKIDQIINTDQWIK